MDKLTLTYALLGHYKECSKKQNSSIFDIFVPIMHKTLLDYMNDCQKSDLKGCALSEIQKKLHDSFALNFPIPVLRKCLLVLQEEINNPTLFNVYNDNSFILQRLHYKILNHY